MAYDKGDGGSGARWLWAALTPVVLAAAAFSILGIFFLPALCVWLDGKSRTYTGAVTAAALFVAAVWLWGGPAMAVAACVAVATAAAYISLKVKAPFTTGLLASSGGGVVGVVALMGILGASLEMPLNEAATSYFNGILSGYASAGYTLPLDLFASAFSPSSQADLTGLLPFFSLAVPKEILSMSVADKLAIVAPVFEQFFAVTIPAVGLVAGMLMGGLGYYLPALAADRRVRKASGAPDVPVPPFAAFKTPKYVVISLLLLQIVSSFGASNEVTGWVTVNTAAGLVLGVLMNIQALSLFSFLLNRRNVAPALQFLILAPAVLIFSWLLYWAGIFDALFDMRAVMRRVEEVRKKGKQVFTPEGLDELRKMQGTKKDKKNGKDGEDGKE